MAREGRTLIPRGVFFSRSLQSLSHTSSVYRAVEAGTIRGEIAARLPTRERRPRPIVLSSTDSRPLLRYRPLYTQLDRLCSSSLINLNRFFFFFIPFYFVIRPFAVSALKRLQRSALPSRRLALFLGLPVYRTAPASVGSSERFTLVN